jgi:hypothetical protein
MDLALQGERFRFRMAAQQADRRAYLISCLQHYQLADYGFPMKMDMSFLQNTRPGTSLPIFGVLDLNDSVFSISCNKSSRERTRTSFTPYLPDELSMYYGKTVDYLYSLIPRNRDGSASVSLAILDPCLKSWKTTSIVQKSVFNGIWVVFELRNST